jgi:GNAT superfamily N-acetyltransferase
VSGAEPTIRRASRADLAAILEVARRALGWSDGDASFLRWKHFENPFGESPMWVAEVDGSVIGFRAFLRWELVARDGRIVRAVRAVDTATDPAFQGRGIFTRLTLAAIDELRDEGIELVFNTPNDKSRPGYLKMGWQVVGRLPAAVRPNTWRFPIAVARARVPASRDAVPTDVGQPGAVALTDRHGLTTLLASTPWRPGLGTARTPEYLAWRYGNPALGYRVVGSDATETGIAVFRLRRRGAAVEAVVGDVFVPEGTSTRRVLREVATSRADYLLHLGGTRHVEVATRAGFVQLPRTGPILTCRMLDGSRGPALREWALTMGDVELL